MKYLNYSIGLAFIIGATIFLFWSILPNQVEKDKRTHTIYYNNREKADRKSVELLSQMEPLQIKINASENEWIKWDDKMKPLQDALKLECWFWNPKLIAFEYQECDMKDNQIVFDDLY